jgi:hypothetical protein
MNAKQLFTAVSFALVGATAFASEATNFPVESGSLTRAEVKAELARAQAAGEIAQVSAAYGSFPATSVAVRNATLPTPVARNRDDVRTEARAAARASFNSQYVGG